MEEKNLAIENGMTIEYVILDCNQNTIEYVMVNCSQKKSASLIENIKMRMERLSEQTEITDAETWE